MFTFGMFTTHIPYIALVAFYAYFLIFGMEKASKGEIVTNKKNPFIYEIKISESFEANNPGCFYYQTTDLFTERAKFENFIFKRKISRKAFTDNLHYRFYFSPTISNRPPPVFS
ncbi:MAG: hypothetical protein ACOC13_03500 [Tangfeifania sp.]